MKQAHTDDGALDTGAGPHTTAARVQARGAVDGYSPPWSSFAALLDERGDQEGDHLLWVAGRGAKPQTWTHRSWREDVLVLAARLRDRGVGMGSSIAVVAHNRPETLLLAFASWYIGACFVPLDPRESTERHEEIVDGIPDIWVAQTDTTRDTADSHGIALPGRPAHEHPDGAQAPLPVNRLDVPALRMHTSGTGGAPKPIIVSMRSLLINCDAMKRAFHWGPQTRALTVLPISHANGLVISSFLPWFAGGSSVLLDGFHRSTFWATARETGATVCSLVPTVMEYLLADGSDATDQELRAGTLTEIFSGSGPMRPDTAVEFEQRFTIPVRQLYGLSETSAVLTVTPKVDAGGLSRELRGSIGSEVPHAVVSVIDPHGVECASGERGEIVARGAMLMDGYAGDASATAAAFADGWFHTGDRGYRRRGPDGHWWFFLEGRLREVIPRAGSAILPQHVDNVVAGHPAIEQAATVGFANRWYGQEVAVYVIPRYSVTEAEILTWCRERLEFAQQPKVVIFGDEMPCTAVGKVRRAVLADRLAEQLSSHWESTFR